MASAVGSCVMSVPMPYRGDVYGGFGSVLWPSMACIVARSTLAGRVLAMHA